MRDDVFTLFDEYAASFARGERPEARDYLQRAGDGRDELAALIEGYLERVPPPAPDDDAVLLASAWLAQQPPVLELRTRRGLRRDDVVAALVTGLRLDGTKRDKVERYYHELEGGLLDPDRVDRRVWGALAETLKARVGDLVAWRPPPMPFAIDAAYRAEADVPAPATLSMRADRVDREPPDEIDRLFGKA